MRNLFLHTTSFFKRFDRKFFSLQCFAHIEMKARKCDFTVQRMNLDVGDEQTQKQVNKINIKHITDKNI